MAELEQAGGGLLLSDAAALGLEKMVDKGVPSGRMRETTSLSLAPLMLEFSSLDGICSGQSA